MEEATRKQESSSSPPAEDALKALLSNPELIQKIGLAMGAMQTASIGAPPTAHSDPPPTTTSHPPSTPLGDGLASLLGDPAMLEQLPRIMTMLKPLLASPPPPIPSKESAPLSPEACRDNLLCALKPFLSPGRRDAVDMILRISKLGTVLQQLK